MTKIKISLYITRIDNNYQIQLSKGIRCISILDLDVDQTRNIDNAYTEWQSAYHGLYSLQKTRAESSDGGSISIDEQDLKIYLKEAEAKLLGCINQSLKQSYFPRKLQNICQSSQKVIIYLDCNNSCLKKIPWEHCISNLVEKGDRKLEILRVPTGAIDCDLTDPRLRPRTRILAIAGDNENIEFDGDLKTLKKLKAEIVLFGNWPPNSGVRGESFEQLLELLKDSQGWDMLYFAGHSGEDSILEGFFKLSGNQNQSLSDIEDSLEQARRNGLQFAFFNSCCGIDLGEHLIRKGIPQALIIREQIHNDTSHTFFENLAIGLNKGLDIGAAFKISCDRLAKEEWRNKYPSAYLIPSLFCHPDAELFKLKPPIYKKIYYFLPSNPFKLAALSIALGLGLIPQLRLQSRIIDCEQAAVSIVREFPASDPKLVLVHIDRESLDASNLTKNKPTVPINKKYLASLIDKLSQSQVRSIAIDYIFDSDKTADNSSFRVLENSIDKARSKKTNFLLASTSTATNNPFLNSLIKGNINTNFYFFGDFPQHMQSSDQNNTSIAPFAYFLSLIQADVVSNLDLKDNIASYNSRIEPPFSLQWLVSPVIDYSKSPYEIYNRISAKQLLEGAESLDLKDKIVLIAPGGYKDAGVEGKGTDNYSLPLPVALRSSFGLKIERDKEYFSGNRPFTGGEVHAYIAHQLLTNSIVFRVSDWIVILIAIPIGGWYILKLRYRHNFYKWLILVTSPLAYLASCLSLYCSFNIAIPFGLPLIVYIIYVAPDLGIKKRHVTNQ